MLDHVHLLMQPLPKTDNVLWSLSEIFHSIKSYTAKQIPKVMNHIGTIWQSERYDRIVRDRQEFDSFWNYVRLNSIEAGLSATPEAYLYFWQQ